MTANLSRHTARLVVHGNIGQEGQIHYNGAKETATVIGGSCDCRLAFSSHTQKREGERKKEKKYKVITFYYMVVKFLSS